MNPKDKAEQLISEMIKVDVKLNLNPMSRLKAIELSIICVKEIQRFGNQMKIREPMMYWGMVLTELNKLKTL